jgi:hypothetical protein
VGDELFHVLHRGDEPVLDLLTPQTPPAGTLEMVILRRLTKAALNQGHPAQAISVGRMAR